MRHCWIAAVLVVLIHCATLPPDVTPEHPLHLCQYSNVGGREFFERVEVTHVRDDGDYDVVFVDRGFDRHGVREHGNVSARTVRPCKAAGTWGDMRPDA